MLAPTGTAQARPIPLNSHPLAGAAERLAIRRGEADAQRRRPQVDHLGGRRL